MTTTSYKYPPELLGEPKAKRKEYFKRKLVGHRMLMAKTEELTQAILEPADSGITLVFGPARVGKSTLRRGVEARLMRHLQAELQDDPGRLPFVSVVAAAPDGTVFSFKDFYLSCLMACAEPMLARKVDLGPHRIDLGPIGEDYVRRQPGTNKSVTTSAARGALIQVLRHRRPLALFVEESQHFLKVGSGRKLKEQMDCIKYLADESGTPFVLIGTYESLPFRNLSAQLIGRSGEVHFPRYLVGADHAADQRAFMNAALAFRDYLPVRELPEALNDWEYLYERTIGCIGVLKQWLVRALDRALNEDAATVTREHLDSTALTMSKLEAMYNEATRGEDELREVEIGHVKEMWRARLGFGNAEKAAKDERTTDARDKSERKPKPSPGRRRPTADPVGVVAGA